MDGTVLSLLHKFFAKCVTPLLGTLLFFWLFFYPLDITHLLIICLLWWSLSILHITLHILCCSLSVHTPNLRNDFMLTSHTCIASLHPLVARPLSAQCSASSLDCNSKRPFWCLQSASVHVSSGLSVSSMVPVCHVYMICCRLIFFFLSGTSSVSMTWSLTEDRLLPSIQKTGKGNCFQIS